MLKPHCLSTLRFHIAQIEFVRLSAVVDSWLKTMSAGFELSGPEELVAWRSVQTNSA